MGLTRPTVVGAASSVITPDLGMEMAGYASRTGPATGVLDDLFCRCVVVCSGEDILVLVVLDLVYVPASVADAVRKRLERSMGVRPASVLISATHTHCGPSLADASLLEADLVDRAVACVEHARAAAVPATLWSSTFPVDDVVHNRRDGRTPPRSSGDVLVALDEGGEVVATIVVVSCHPTVLEGDTVAYSADYPGRLGAAIAELAGGAVLVMQGFAGDVNPSYEDHSPRDMAAFGRLLGVRAAASVLTVQHAARPHRTINLSRGRSVSVPPPTTVTQVDLSGGLQASWVDVEVEARPRLTHEQARDALDGVRHELEADERNGEAGVVARLQAAQIDELLSRPQTCVPLDLPTGEHDRLPVQVMRLGPRLCLIALPGEPFIASGREIQAAIPGDVLLVGYANRSAGYLPPIDEFAASGYEVGSTRYRPGTAERLVTAAVTLATTGDRHLVEGESQ